MLCPTDTYNQIPFNGSVYSGSPHYPWDQGTTNYNDGWARGNYGTNASLGYMTPKGNWPQLYAAAGPDAPGWENTMSRGVMGVNASVSISKMVDGTSTTIMLAELRAGLTEADVRGTWAMSGGGASSLWAHGYIGGSPNNPNGPNSPGLAGDDTEGCNHVHETFGGGENSGGAGIIGLAELGMGCARGDQYPNSQAGTRSMHDGGVYACFADGSVHFISDYIQTGYDQSVGRSVWDRINLSADGEVVGHNQF